MLHSTCGSVSLKMWGRKCCIFDDFSLCYSRSVTDPKICYKCVCSRGSARNPAGGAHEAPPDPLVAWAPHPTPLGACGTSTLSPVGDPQYFFFYKSDTGKTANLRHRRQLIPPHSYYWRYFA